MGTSHMTTIKRKSLAAALACLTLASAAQSESIQQWPSYDGLNLEPLKTRFIEVFESKPSNFSHMVKGFEECKLTSDKAGKLSGVNIEAMESVFADNKDIQVEIDLDVDKLTVSSTAQGCIALDKVKLEKIPGNQYEYYQVPSDFSHSYLIYADYETNHVYVNNINGTEHKTESSSDNELYSYFIQSKASINKKFPKEFYQISKVVTSNISLTSYGLTVTPQIIPSTGIINVNLSRSENSGKFSNSLNITEKLKGHDTVMSMIGNHTYMSILDGKMHGLHISDNYMYASDKTQDPYMNSCYNMGEKFDVFKILPNKKCVKASDDKIGEAGVHVDAIYKMRLDSKKRTAEMQENHRKRMAKLEADREERLSNREKRLSKKESFNNNISKSVGGIFGATGGNNDLEEKRRLAEREKKQKKDKEFAETRKQAKCQLMSYNWAYLGDSCKNGYADGEGSSIDRKGLKFVGTFKAGQRVKGDIMQNDEMIFSGDLKNDKPDGGAICLFEGEYEECRFFRGKRIDTLYKIRKENAKNLAKMEKIQKENAMAAQRHNNSNNSQSNKPNALVGAIEKEATRRAASFIFDQLF